MVPAISEISEIVGQQETKSQQIIDGNLQNPFDMEALLKYWHQYIDELIRDKKINLKSMMTAYAPKLDGTNITLLLDYKTQEEYFNEDRINLTNYLRTHLQNYAITVNAEIIEAVAQEKIMHTQNDVYKHFLTLNPNLQALVSELNLEFDTSKDN